MRTTLTLDEQIAKALKDVAHRTGKPFKQVVNEALQAGLAAGHVSAKARRYHVKPAALGGVLGSVDLNTALQLADALEDREDRAQACVAQVILVDANLLIYAVDRDSPHHVLARRWLEDTRSRSESVGIPWIAALAFVRITTHPGIMRSLAPPSVPSATSTAGCVSRS